MIIIINIILIALSLSVDSFVFALSYAPNVKNYSKCLLLAVFVGIFHFFMPLIGSFFGIKLFEYTYISPRIIMFIVFLLLSIDMIMNYFDNNKRIIKLNLVGMIIFSFSVSLDSFSVGIGLKYMYNSVLVCTSIFCIVSFFITSFGFFIGKSISQKVGKYAFVLSSVVLFFYSIWVLTK